MIETEEPKIGHQEKRGQAEVELDQIVERVAIVGAETLDPDDSGRREPVGSEHQQRRQ